MSSGLPIIHKVESIDRFKEILANNPGLVIVKFGAKWCGPCKTIEADVNDIFSKMPPTVQCIKLDIDESFEIYSFLKAKRMVNGVPVILCYKKGNFSYIPNETVVGANKGQLIYFFEKCFTHLQN